MTQFDPNSSDVAMVDWDRVAGRDRTPDSDAAGGSSDGGLGGNALPLATLAARSAFVGAVMGSLGGPAWTLLGAAMGLAMALAFADRAPRA